MKLFQQLKDNFVGTVQLTVDLSPWYLVDVENKLREISLEACCCLLYAGVWGIRVQIDKS